MTQSLDLFLQKRLEKCIIISIALSLDVQNLFRILIFHLLYKSYSLLMQDALLNHGQQMFDAIDTVVIVELIPRIPVVLSKNPLLKKF